VQLRNAEGIPAEPFLLNATQVGGVFKGLVREGAR
jgi:hypothetical protein